MSSTSSMAQDAGRLKESHVLRLVNHYLSMHEYETAIFLCERLHAQSPRPHILHKLATCYFATGDAEKTFMLLRGCSSADNRYLYAVCAEKLGNLHEAEQALLSGGLTTFEGTSASSSASRLHLFLEHHKKLMKTSSYLPGDAQYTAATRDFVQNTMNVPNGAAGMKLLGTVCRKANRKEHAQRCFEISLDLDPYMWSAYEALCEMGFGLTYAARAATRFGQDGPGTKYQTTDADQGSNGGLSSTEQFRTPSYSSNTFKTPSGMTPGTPVASVARDPGGLSVDTNTPVVPGSGIPTPRNPVGRPRAHPSVRGEAEDDLPAADSKATESLLSLMSTLGRGYYYLCQYDCRRALQIFSSLSVNDYRSGWVLNQVARCHFEMADYKSAYTVFKQLRRQEPYRRRGMELYSTTLWQLKKEMELSYLAQQLVEFGRTSPQVWCAVGNCFSLQKEHELALKFFQRAIQIDPGFTYAYTLSGHEYVSNEDFDKAIECYRHAIRTDDRHYNAWYGLGQIYFRQEKYEVAEFHFRRALGINTGSSVLCCYVGMALSRMDKVC